MLMKLGIVLKYVFKTGFTKEICNNCIYPVASYPSIVGHVLQQQGFLGKYEDLKASSKLSGDLTKKSCALAAV